MGSCFSLPTSCSSGVRHALCLLQVDQDLEVLATGFGLLTRFEPLLLTDRHGVYFFAHPPLLHFYVAGSFLFQGSLDELETYDEASRRVRDVWGA